MDTKPSPLRTLDEIFVIHGTDKGSQHPAGGHNYSPHYRAAFEPLRFDPLVMTEIGCGGGESMRAWLEYFQSPEFRLFGADIVRDTNPWNTPSGRVSDPRYTFIHLNQDDETNLKCFAAMCGGEFDIVIDDGSHRNDSIITSFNVLWNCVRPAGLYIIEDYGCGYTTGSVHVKPGMPDHRSWLHALADRVVTGAQEIDSVTISQELVILRRKA